MPRVGLHHDPRHAAHDPGGHPEHPGRVSAILAHIEACDLGPALMPVLERVATDDDLRLVHDQRLIDAVQRAETIGGAWLDADTVVMPGSVEAARRAVGGALEAVDRVLDGRLDRAFCVDRPPGHHAARTGRWDSVCSTRLPLPPGVLRRHGLERVAIVDFDVHHGNGTQDAFWRDGAVLYCSTHEYPFYPGTGHWRGGRRGRAPARRSTCRCRPAAVTRVLRRFDRVALPALRRHAPQLILVSAGFDAHLADPLASMAVTAAGYEGMARRLVEAAAELCDGRLVYVLEGGYRLEAIARAAELSLRAMLGEPPSEPAPAGVAPREDVARLIGAVGRLHNLT
ncbi:MAG: histone deacetylase [Dehalococcoidia bacterium]